MSYAELHCKTNFSFLEGASHADELLPRAAELGYAAVAVTDRDTLAGIVRAHAAAKASGVKLIVGAEVHLADALPAVLWATDRASYGRLCRLLTVGRRRAEKGKCQLWLADVAEHAAGLLAGVLPTSRSETVHNKGADQHSIAAYREIFTDRAYLLAELFRGREDARRLAELQTLSQQTCLPLVAAGDVLYHARSRLPLYDVVTAIRQGITLEEGRDRLPNAERHLRPIHEITDLFAAVPEAVSRTLEVAERCRFSLDELRYEYPEELVPDGFTPDTFLAQLAWQGAADRYPAGLPEKVRRMIEHELALIRDLKYEAYFLTVWDLVRFARSRNILCQGRGSAANSAVCYCLEVTSVDPDRTDLLFERFISRERNEAPDIDVDFEHERREEVLQYLYAKYGRERAGMTAVVITYRSRSAIRDVGKALGLSLDRVDALAKNVEGYSREGKLEDRAREVGLNPQSLLGQRFIHLVNELIGFPRHLSQHVGGMVMTQGPLCELAPVENAAMPNRTIIQWDKNDLDELGILKVDCLSLGMLTAIRKCFDLVRQHHGREVTLATLPAEDPQVYDMICRADTMGVFQIESRAQMSMLPRLKPRDYYDLVIEVAIVRPGPIQGNMVHPYLRRRQGLEEVTYPSEAIREVLFKTLGVPLFQEQAMKLAVVAAGFTPGEADQLRRAMGAWRKTGVIDRFRVKLIDGMLARGLSGQFAEQVFNQIRGFGEYGFPESHAASFALLVYVSAWLKRYYPAAFCASLINSQPMGFYAPSQLIRDAREHGVRVLPLDVNHSEWDCTLEREVIGEEKVASGQVSEAGAAQLTTDHRPLATFKALRLGFRLIAGMSHKSAEILVAARAQSPFRSLVDFAQRTKLPRSVLTLLAEADAFGSLEQDRREALWQALGQEAHTVSRPLFTELEEDDPAVPLPALSAWENVRADYRATGLSLTSHPLSFVRERLAARRIVTSAQLANLTHGQQLSVAGLVLLRQRPSTAKGITFVTLEDETGVANLVIKQPVWDRNYAVARHSGAWIAHGRLERHEAVIHLVVNRLEDLSASLDELHVKSRDFR